MNLDLLGTTQGARTWNASVRVPVELYSGFDATPAAMAADRRRHLLSEAIRSLPEFAADRDYPTPSSAKIGLARTFVTNIPENRLLPKVAVDDEGDILMAWGDRGELCALTLEGRVLHMVVNPGSRSTHIEPTVYNGGRLPVAILGAIPLR